LSKAHAHNRSFQVVTPYVLSPAGPFHLRFYPPHILYFTTPSKIVHSFRVFHFMIPPVLIVFQS
jgi:hypothetical protein